MSERQHVHRHPPPLPHSLPLLLLPLLLLPPAAPVAAPPSAPPPDAAANLKIREAEGGEIFFLAV